MPGWCSCNAGPRERLLQGLGLTDQPIALINNEFGTVLATLHILLPFMVLPLYATMQRIPRDLMLAGASLGGGPSTSSWVFLPLSMPGVVAGTVLVFVLALGFYITPELLGGGRTFMVSMLVSRNVELYNQWGAASAIGSCCWSASPPCSGSPPGWFPSSASWEPADAGLAPRPPRARHRRRPGAAVPGAADPDRGADVVLERPVPHLPAARLLLALVRGLLRQPGLDAGGAGEPRGGIRHRARRHADRHRGGLRAQHERVAACPQPDGDPAPAAGRADRHHGDRRVLRLRQTGLLATLRASSSPT